jgi:peptidoglycan/LPS O-acetylase OafA/YrhL
VLLRRLEILPVITLSYHRKSAYGVHLRASVTTKEFELKTIEEMGASISINRAPSEIKAERSTSLPKGSPSIHLDALRGLAAFSVLLAHLRDAFFVDYPMVPHHNPVLAAAYFVTGLGHQWVIVFFVMSGYLVGGSVLRTVNVDRWSWRSYLLTRLTRLYIVLLPALLLGGVIDWTGMHIKGSEAIYSGHSGMHLITANVHSTLTWPALLGNCLFLQTIALPGMKWQPVPIFGSNGPLWSLANEFWYYIAFPLLVLLMAKGRSWTARTMCSIGLLIWGWFVGAHIVLLGIPWLMGMAITILPPLRLRRRWIHSAAIISALVVFCGGLALGKARDTLSSSLVLGAVVTYLIWVILHCATAPLSTLYVRVAQRSARCSYTLYLVHLPMLILLKTLSHIPRMIPTGYICFVSAGTLLAILLYAQIVYEIFEKNTDRVRNAIKPYVLGRGVV